MPEYLAPGVFVEEVSFRPKTIEGVSTSTTGFVGPARFGPVEGEPPLLTSFADFERIYGGLDRLSASPFEPSPKGFHLYSAPTRKAPRWMGVVRGELAVSGANRRAAHAVVRVALPEGRIWHGMADSRGRFVVILPYPTISGGFGSSPPVAGGGALSTQTWTVTLEVLYEPGRLEALPETRVPEYRSIFQQGPATIWPVPQSEGGNEVAELTATLEFGRELILKTAGLSQLLVSPAGSSP